MNRPTGFEPLAEPPDHDGDHAVFVVRDDKILVAETDGGARPLDLEEAAPLARTKPLMLLGRHRETLYWLAEMPHGDEPGPGQRLEGLRNLHGQLAEHEWNIGGRATQLSDWRRDHRFCGRCGAEMELVSGERAMRCHLDGYTAYPRLAPAVIMLIERADGRALLARSGRWETPMYSTLAGFVEAGETLEDTVRREVREEVGVEVDEIAYFGSQPWPFPNSLMVGFTARWTGGDIDVDGEEIAHAAWFSPDDLPMIPPKMSIARQLIDAWVAKG